MKKVLCIGLALALCAPVLAQTPGLLSFSGGSTYSSYYGSAPPEGDVIGWEFAVNDNITVTDLGAWNDSISGMLDTHKVGIWDMNENLLGMVVVDPTDPLVDDFRYHSLATPLALTAGENYVIGAGGYYSAGNDWYVSSASSASWSPEITFQNSRYPLAIDMGFVFPASISGSIGRFGPNFLFPEPCTLITLAGLALLRRR